MTSDGYDKIVNAIILWSMRSVILTALFLCSFATIGGLWLAIFGIMKIELYFPGFWIILASIIGTLIVYFPGYFHRKANLRVPNNDYKDKVKFRDLWMAWATVLEYDMKDRYIKNSRKWIEENATGLHRIHRGRNSKLGHDTCLYFFSKKSDAMAFKLVWEEKNTL